MRACYEIREDVAKEIMAYFQIKDTTGSNPGMVWEAHKAVIRGILIKHGSRRKREREKQIKKLLEEIQVLESQHRRTQAPAVGRELMHLRRQITDILRYKAKAKIQLGGKQHTNWETNVVNYWPGNLKKEVRQHIYRK